jgi:dolichol-phosphate mannosyltransferase
LSDISSAVPPPGVHERDSAAASAIELSVVVPVKNEADNILPLIEEIDRALTPTGVAYEIVYIDDGSNDATPARLAEAAKIFPRLRRLRHARSCGQSAAIRSGVFAARGYAIATLDGDGQNDPADLPRLWTALTAAGADLAMVAGQRVKRRDTLVRRWSSRIANGVRAGLLGDDTPDTGCGLKLFRRDAFLRLPYFDHMHRFLPALMKREGLKVGQEAVNHRPRERGTSKYGINNRLWVSLVDLVGVIWLQSRARHPASRAVELRD